LKVVRSILPSQSLVQVPEVLAHFQDGSLLILEDCGPVPNLKQLLIDQPPSASLAAKIGEELGKFLAFLHNASTESREAVKQNTQGQILSAWVTYGRLVTTLDGTANLPALAPAHWSIAESELMKVKNVADRMQIEMTRVDLPVIVHGDFWPGNICCVLSGEDDDRVLKKLYVIDWELSKPGVPALDIGQLFAEMHLLRKFKPQTSVAGESFVNAFQAAYSSRKTVAESELAQTALRHVGAHLVAWGPRVPWGADETVREVVKEGVELLNSHFSQSWLYQAFEHSS
jgi:Ser/Thr protein kinase RdoA (MazF antagonist)